MANAATRTRVSTMACEAGMWYVILVKRDTGVYGLAGRCGMDSTDLGRAGRVGMFSS